SNCQDSTFWAGSVVPGFAGGGRGAGAVVSLGTAGATARSLTADPRMIKVIVIPRRKASAGTMIFRTVNSRGGREDGSPAQRTTACLIPPGENLLMPKDFRTGSLFPPP